MNPRHSQQGATLIVSLIMLVAMTLFAVSAINLSTMNLKIAGNMQAQRLMEMAAQHAIERMLSTPPDYSLTPTTQPSTTSVLPAPVPPPPSLPNPPATA